MEILRKIIFHLQLTLVFNFVMNKGEILNLLKINTALKSTLGINNRKN
jgi:hypothetical protein